ncbi:hypothetical protein [Collinsella aerofaciens]|uniref:hypothetical protein n=1 Tax=Collinsella aerofaciens TaxID=74426 RepID=UPI003D79D286
MTTEKELCFTVFEREITLCMEGDREESKGWDVCDELNVNADSDFDGVVSTVRKWAANDSVEVCRTRYGIGSITRPVYDVCAWCKDGDGGFMTCDLDGNASSDSVFKLDVLDLHPEYLEAWNKAKGEYYTFLDYESDTFPQVADYLEDK